MEEEEEEEKKEKEEERGIDGAIATDGAAVSPEEIGGEGIGNKSNRYECVCVCTHERSSRFQLEDTPPRT